MIVIGLEDKNEEYKDNESVLLNTRPVNIIEIGIFVLESSSVG